MFTLWPEPVELPEDRTNTPMYKTEVFDSPENAKIAFEQACKENKFPFIYMRPVNQAEFEEQQRQKQANLNSNFPKQVSIPSFTVSDDSIKNPNATNEKTYTSTGNFISEEQKKYTETINKVYEPTGTSLEEKDRPVYSITKEQDDKAEEWWKKHYKKYHSKKHKTLCAGMESEFVYEWHFTNIGPYCIAVCKDCERLYNEQKEKAKNILKQYNEDEYEDEKKSKKVLKEYEKADKLANQLYKQATFTIREIDE